MALAASGTSTYPARASSRQLGGHRRGVGHVLEDVRTHGVVERPVGERHRRRLGVEERTRYRRGGPARALASVLGRHVAIDEHVGPPCSLSPLPTSSAEHHVIDGDVDAPAAERGDFSDPPHGLHGRQSRSRPGTMATVPVRPVVVAFDVDGTLTTRDCVVPFLLAVAGPTRLAIGLTRAPPPWCRRCSVATVTR